MVGAEQPEDGTEEDTKWSFDCWKPVVHDESTAPSSGMPLSALLADPRVRSHTVRAHDIIVHNQWGETYSLAVAPLPKSSRWELGLHATRI